MEKNSLVARPVFRLIFYDEIIWLQVAINFIKFINQLVSEAQRNHSNQYRTLSSVIKWKNRIWGMDSRDL